MKFKINVYNSKICYFSISDNTKGGNIFLWKDGTLNYGSTGYKKAGDSYDKALGYWKTKQEAEQFLKNWLPSKDLLTKEQVRERAGVSDVSALDCSIEHWKQVVFLGYGGCKKSEEIKMNEDYCALCQRYECGFCDGCPLETCSDGSLFRAVIDRFGDGANEFEEASVNMFNKLINIRNKKYGIMKRKLPEPLINKLIQVNFAEFEAKLMLQDMKGKEMIELTVKEVAERLGVDEVKIVKEKSIDVEKKYQFKHGDTVVSFGPKRIIISIAGVLTAFGELSIQGKGQKYFENNNYKLIENVFSD